MHIEIYKYCQDTAWGFDIRGDNNAVVAENFHRYVNKRNALKTARAIAGKRMKVIVCE